MPFKKGSSGNPAGRPKGSKNKASDQVKELIEELLTDTTNQEHIKAQFKKMKGYSLFRAFSELTPFILPKLSANTHDHSFEKMTDDQLTEVIESLKKSALGSEG